MKIFHTNWAAGLYLLLLLIGALIPLGMGSAILGNNFVLEVRADYLLHAIAYIPFPVILMLSLWGRQKGWMRVVLISLIVVVLFETVQMLIPYRGFNINDMIANGIGVGIGLILFAVFGTTLSKITASAD